MSHFTVLVIGDDVDKQLAPYDENLEVPMYRREDDSEDTARFIEWVKENGGSMPNTDDELQRFIADWHVTTLGPDGRYGGIDDGKLWYWSTFNKRSKWDWYETGGRWDGFFVTKDGRRVNECRADQIDWSAMLDSRRVELDGAYARAMADEEADERTRFFFYGLREGEDRDSYVGRQLRIGTHAVVKDGEWYEKGRMGWWAIVTDEKAEAEWHTQWQQLVGGLPPETKVTLVDCHI